MERKFNVLWLDDELNGNMKDTYDASKEDFDSLDIIGVIDIISFREAFKTRNWDAIIFDINIKEDIEVDDVPDLLLPVIMADFADEIKDKNIPVFAFTGAIGMHEKKNNKITEPMLKSYGFQQHPRTQKFYWDKSPINEYQDVIFEDIINTLKRGICSQSDSTASNREQITCDENQNLREISNLSQKKLENLSVVLHRLRHNTISPNIGFLKGRIAKLECISDVDSVKIKEYLEKYDILGKFDIISKEIDEVIEYFDKFDFRTIPIDIFSICKDLQKDNQDLSIRICCSENTIVYADSELKRSVFDNIISNAKTHAFYNRDGQNNIVKIDIEKYSDTLQVQISNNGHVFNGDCQKVFENKYFCGETGHTGEGLYIVKQYMEFIGGNVDFISSPKDEYPVTIVLTFKID